MLETDTTLLNSLEQKGLQVTHDSTKNIYNIKCDVVVVGYGYGGGVVATVLASSGHKVIVLEKGNYFTHLDYSSLEAPNHDQLYEARGILVTADGEIIIQARSTVGGGSVVNWSAYIKTPDYVLQEWNTDHKIKFFGGQEYHFAMNTVWERIDVTENCIEEGFQNQVLRKRFENLGLEVDVVPRNYLKKHYYGFGGHGYRKRENKGTDSTWLVDVVDHGAVILTGCKAEKFVLETGKNESKRKQKCLGVMAKALSNNITKRLQIEAKVTVLACRALLTPLLMLSSGLKNKNIGRNFHLHPVLMTWGYFPNSNLEFKGKTFKGGIITSVHKVVSPDSRAKTIIETLELELGTFSALCPWESGEYIKNRMLKFSRTAYLISIIRDRGSGVVMNEGIVSYEFSALDKENIKEGLRQSLKILIAVGAVEVGIHRSDGLRLKCKRIDTEELEDFFDMVTADEGPQ